ncbi:MAG: hypothetical protein ACREMC_11505 [Gemmatimonadales bacterium]
MTDHPSGDPFQAAPWYLAVVRQGHREVFQFLSRFQDSNFTEVVWDRRTGERRTAQEIARLDRRGGERRSLTSAPWDALGLLLVPLARPNAQPPASQVDRATKNLCVIRRGHLDVFQVMQEHFSGDASVEVIWDRRTLARRYERERPTAARRRGDRLP